MPTMSAATTDRKVGWHRRPRARAAIAATLLILPVLTWAVAEADIGPFDESCDQRAAHDLKVLHQVLDEQLPPEQARQVWYENVCEYSYGGAANWSVGPTAQDDVQRLVRAGWAEVSVSNLPAPFQLIFEHGEDTVFIAIDCEDGSCEAQATVGSTQ